MKIVSENNEITSIDGVLFYEIAATGSIFFGPFAVRSTCNGKGYGRALIEEMEAIGRENNIEFASMHVVNWRTKLIALYTYLGFETLEETHPYPDDSRLTRPSHFVCMRRKIK